MEITYEQMIKIKNTEEITSFSISCYIYDDDYEVYKDGNQISRPLPGMVGRHDEGMQWEVLIDIETGKIVNWEEGYSAKIFAKVCDGGEYHLVNDEGDPVLEMTDCYVPSALDFHNGYGDYLEFEINSNGVIKEWKHFNINKYIDEATRGEDE